ncbi:MAG TPA: PhnD/SsuA/transferrin family substrate-binding protein [Propylenella sp.]
MRAILTALAGCLAGPAPGNSARAGCSVQRTAMRPRSLLCGAAFLSVVLAGAAAAQDDGGPLRFLRPAIEGQQAGEQEPPPPPGSSEVEASPDTSPEDAASGTAPDAVAAEDDEESAEADAEREAPADAAEAEITEPPAAPVVPPLAAEPAEEQSEPDPEDTASAARLREPLRFSVLAGRSAAATMAAVEPIAEDLGRILGRPVEILPFSSYSAMIDAQAQRRIDGGFFSAVSYVAAESLCVCLDPLVAPRAGDGTLAYHALIVSKSGSGIASLADLEGRTVAVAASADSIGARRMQLAGLMAEGIDPSTLFGGVVVVESAEEGVRRVAGGGADAAFAWSSLSGPVERGYSRGTLAGLAASGEIAVADIAIVWRSEAITHGPFAVARSLPDPDKERIAAYLVRLESRHPDAYDVLNPYYAGGYAPVEPQDYAGLNALMTQDVDALRLRPAPVRAEPVAVDADMPEGAEDP